MPNRLSSAKRDHKADEKARLAEESFKDVAEAKRRKAEKKAQRYAEKKAVAACEPDLALHDLPQRPNESLAPFELRDDALEGLAKDRLALNMVDSRGEGTPIDVLVQCMTGEEFWLTPLPEESVADLKDALSEVWGIPSVCQQLLVDCTCLRDSEPLWHHMKDGEISLTCTDIVVLGELRDPQILAKLALRGGEGILNAVYHAIGSEDDGTRYQMFTEVRKFAKEDDPRAVAIIIEIMKSSVLPSMRAEIIQSLACIGARCEHAHSAIISQLQQPEACVRIAVLQALSLLFAESSQGIICVVSDCLEDNLEEVRFQAVQALAHIASNGHHDAVVVEIKKRLEHVVGGVRRAAVQALSQVIGQGECQSHYAESLFLPLLADCDADVRVAAVQAIDITLHSQQAFEALVVALFDIDWCVRQLTLRTLKRFAQKDVDFLLASARSYLRHHDARIRCTALEALGMAQESLESLVDEDVISDFKSFVSDHDALVSSTAVRLLREFAQ